MPRLCTLRVTSASDSALLDGQTLWQAQGFGHFCIRVARSAFREHCYHSGRQAWGNIRRQEIILCGRWTWVMFWRAETTRFFDFFWSCRPFEIRYQVIVLWQVPYSAMLRMTHAHFPWHVQYFRDLYDGICSKAKNNIRAFYIIHIKTSTLQRSCEFPERMLVHRSRDFLWFLLLGDPCTQILCVKDRGAQILWVPQRIAQIL